MGLFGHLKFIGNMKGEAALQKLEDPSEVFDYNYTQQLEKIQEMRRALADIVTNEKHIELLESQVEAKAAEKERQAKAALQAGREDLAKQALQQKQALLTQAEGYKSQHTQLGAEHQKIEALVSQMETKAQEFSTQKEMVKAQYQAAQSQVHVTEMVTGINKDNEQMNLAMQRAQDKVLNMQAHADALDALLASGGLQDQNTLGSGQTALDRQLEQISSAHNVDSELEALKASMNG